MQSKKKRILYVAIMRFNNRVLDFKIAIYTKLETLQHWYNFKIFSEKCWLGEAGLLMLDLWQIDINC